MVRKKPACTACGRPRRGHQGPIGVKCTLGRWRPPGLPEKPIGVPDDDQQGGGGGQPGDPPRGEPHGPAQPDIPPAPEPDVPEPNPVPGGAEGEHGGHPVPGPVQPVGPVGQGEPVIPQPPAQPQPGVPQPGPQPPQGPGGGAVPGGVPVVPQQPVGPIEQPQGPIMPHQPVPAPVPAPVGPQPPQGPVVPQQPVPVPGGPQQPVPQPVVPVPVQPQPVPGPQPVPAPVVPVPAPVGPQQPNPAPVLPQQPVPAVPAPVPAAPAPVVPQQPHGLPQPAAPTPSVPQYPYVHPGALGQPGMVGLSTDPGSVPGHPYGYTTNGLYDQNVSNGNVGSVAATLTQCGNLLSNIIPNSACAMSNQDITRMVGQCIAQLSGVLSAGSMNPRVYNIGGNMPNNVSPVNGLGVTDPRASLSMQVGANTTANQQQGVYNMNGASPNHVFTGFGANQPVANQVQPGVGNDTPTQPLNNTHVPGPLAGNGLQTMGATGPNAWIYMTPQDSGVLPGQYSTTAPIMAGNRTNGRNTYPVGTIPYKLRSQGIPARVIEAAIEGEWVDIGEFLPPIGVNINSANTELEPVLDGNAVSYRPKRNRRQITNYDTWYLAWCNYEKLLISVHGAALHEIMCDYRTFIMESNKKYLWSAVSMYDQRHRARLGALLTLNERLSFSSPSQDLISTVLDATAVKPNAQRCQRCRSYDHQVGLCPFPEVKGAGSLQNKVKTQNQSQEICLNFNREKCNSDKCPRKHICKQCRGQLPYARCHVSGPCSRGQVPPNT